MALRERGVMELPPQWQQGHKFSPTLGKENLISAHIGKIELTP